MTAKPPDALTLASARERPIEPGGSIAGDNIRCGLRVIKAIARTRGWRVKA